MFCPIVTCVCNYLLLTITCNPNTTIQSINMADLRGYSILDLSELVINEDILLNLPADMQTIPSGLAVRGKKIICLLYYMKGNANPNLKFYHIF